MSKQFMLPFISVIIPTLNEEKFISKCLQSIKNLDYPKNRYEIIIVDNGSKDKTIKIAKKFDCKVFIKPNITISALRNIGAKHAKGDILAFLDADCTVDKDWLKIASYNFKKEKDLVATGNHYLLPSSVFWLENLWNFFFVVFDKREVYLPGGNLLVRKKIFERVGGFDEKLSPAGDPEFCYRLYKQEYLLKYNPNLRVIHLGCPKNLFEFVYKKVWYAMDYPYLFKKYGLKTKMGKKFIILISLILIFILTINYFLFFK